MRRDNDHLAGDFKWKEVAERVIYAEGCKDILPSLLWTKMD